MVLMNIGHKARLAFAVNSPGHHGLLQHGITLPLVGCHDDRRDRPTTVT